MRPGERLVEELMTANEKTSSTPHEKIFVARTEQVDAEALAATVDALQSAAMRSDHARIRALLEGFLEGCKFEPTVAPTREGAHRDTTGIASAAAG